MDMTHRLYIVTLQGGDASFSVSVNGNPHIHHDPAKAPTSVHTVMLTPEGAEELLRVFNVFNVNAAVRCAELMTEEQRVEQERLLGRMGQEERVWPTASCPSCFWFDPLQEEVPCGASAWPADVRKAAYEAHASARTDLYKCPLPMTLKEYPK